MLDWKLPPPDTTSYRFAKRSLWPSAYKYGIVVATIDCALGYTIDRAVTGNHPELSVYVIGEDGFWFKLDTAATLNEAKQLINNYFGETL